jgi:hypothetical protein
LLSFIHAHASADYEKAQGTRAEMNFIKSMYNQYGPKGLRVVFVDAAYIKTGRFTDQGTRINYTYDWVLPKEMPLLADTKAQKIAKLYGVHILPTTLLIGGDGVVTQRWDNLALSQQMAFAIEALVGAPWFRDGQGNQAVNTALLDKSAWSTPAQTKFHGFGPARPLSGNIWLVDQGMKWSTKAPFPVSWVVLYNNKVDPRIKVTARNVDTGATFALLDKALEFIPASEGKVLLTNFPNTRMKVYKIDARMELKTPGKYEISANIYDKNEDKPLLSGTARIIAD